MVSVIERFHCIYCGTCCICNYINCYIETHRIKQRRYVQDEEALANSGAFTLSNPLVSVKDEGEYEH